MRVGSICTAIVLAMIAVPLASADDVFVVSPKVIEFYNGTYKSLKPPRAIAVADDGFHFGYSYCPEYRCTMNPTARNLAMQGCVKGGGRGCRIFAIDDDIKVNYRVMDLSDLRPPEPGVVPPEPTQPCVGKTQEQCQKIAADFDPRRRKVDADWDSQIARWRLLLCGPPGSQNTNSVPCKQKLAELNEQRSAELKALDDERATALSNPSD